MRQRITNLIESIGPILIDGERRTHLQFAGVFLIFGIVSLAMTILNVLFHWLFLTYLTLGFGVLCLINFALTFINRKVEMVTRIVFAIEIIVLFTCFAVNGEPEGFSVLWSVLLPTAGILLYGIRWGSILSLFQWCILVFLFWSPLGRECLNYEYTLTFTIRFPFLYLAFYLIGIFFEFVLSFTRKLLVNALDRAKELSVTCPITGLGNTTKYMNALSEVDQYIENGIDFAVFSMDLNGIKYVDDTFGHRFGNELIVTAGHDLSRIFPTSHLFHIGGDEFVAIVLGDDFLNIEDKMKILSDKMEYRMITYDGIEIPLSLAFGYSIHKKGERYLDTYQRADDFMYMHKKKIKTKYNIQERKLE